MKHKFMSLPLYIFDIIKGSNGDFLYSLSTILRLFTDIF
jgi:hypothetical protein